MKLMVVILLLEFHVKSFKAVYKEITLAVFDMDPSNAAGPDGFNGYINHHCWNFIQQDVWLVVQESFRVEIIHR